MSGWISKDVTNFGAAVVVGASGTTPVTKTVAVRAGGHIRMIVDFNVSAIAVTTAIAAVIQDSADGAIWNSKKSLSLTTTGWKSISLLVEASGDQTYLPLRPLARLVLTTGTGDSATVATVLWTQEYGG